MQEKLSFEKKRKLPIKTENVCLMQKTKNVHIIQKHMSTIYKSYGYYTTFIISYYNLLFLVICYAK